MGKSELIKMKYLLHTYSVLLSLRETNTPQFVELLGKTTKEGTVELGLCGEWSF